MLDDLVLEIIGFDEKAERDAVLNQLYDAVMELVTRRLARSRKSSAAPARRSHPKKAPDES